jgi:uncharacterized protein (TIGR00369 family)
MLLMNPDWIDLQRFIREGQVAATLNCNPMSEALGMRMEHVDLAKGEITLSFEPQGLFIQGAGVLQGGAVSAMLDFAMAFAVMATLPEGQSCATSSLNISFLRPAPKGRYVAVGETERRGKALAFTRARLFQEGASERVVATATSLLALFQIESKTAR